MLPSVAFDCPTGNCTYDIFHTLALDYQCKELPHLLEFGCHNATSAEWMSRTDYYEIAIHSILMPLVASCGWHLDVPNYGQQLMSG